MENNEVNEVLTPKEEEMKNQLIQALNQLKMFSEQNAELQKQNVMYKVSDFYQRVGFLWQFVKEGKEVFSPEFLEYATKEIENLFTVVPEETKEEEEKNNGTAE